MSKNNKKVCLFIKNNLFNRVLLYLIKVNLKN